MELIHSNNLPHATNRLHELLVIQYLVIPRDLSRASLSRNAVVPFLGRWQQKTPSSPIHVGPRNKFRASPRLIPHPTQQLLLICLLGVCWFCTFLCGKHGKLCAPPAQKITQTNVRLGYNAVCPAGSFLLGTPRSILCIVDKDQQSKVSQRR